MTGKHKEFLGFPEEKFEHRKFNIGKMQLSLQISSVITFGVCMESV